MTTLNSSNVISFIKKIPTKGLGGIDTIKRSEGWILFDLIIFNIETEFSRYQND